MKKFINDLPLLIALWIISTLVIGAIFIEFPRMGKERDKMYSLVGKYVKVGNDTLQVTGYIGGEQIVLLSNGNKMGIDFAYDNQISK